MSASYVPGCRLGPARLNHSSLQQGPYELRLIAAEHRLSPEMPRCNRYLASQIATSRTANGPRKSAPYGYMLDLDREPEDSRMRLPVTLGSFADSDNQ